MSGVASGEGEERSVSRRGLLPESKQFPTGATIVQFWRVMKFSYMKVPGLVKVAV